MNNIKSKLRNFKLAGMASSLEERLLYANNNKLDYQEFLDILCNNEDNNRIDQVRGKDIPNLKSALVRVKKLLVLLFQLSV